MPSAVLVPREPTRARIRPWWNDALSPRPHENPPRLSPSRTGADNDKPRRSQFQTEPSLLLPGTTHGTWRAALSPQVPPAYYTASLRAKSGATLACFRKVKL
ncbi:hypothetical protein XA68_14425 [Ophiocordyceps unilateralis]|uniref:Uncharacterized protein n=1 Tax=Ophiocordyceps unilateralis TaxID=268505 RepID=A0A2A9P9L8_OPHUN|nr:hypothetical protein XA68_14425 [Ophiocordyceps unilateralis]